MIFHNDLGQTLFIFNPLVLLVHAVLAEFKKIFARSVINLGYAQATHVKVPVRRH